MQQFDWFLIVLLVYLTSRWLRLRALSETLKRASVAWSLLKYGEPPKWSTSTIAIRSLLNGKLRKVFRKIWWLFIFVLLLGVTFLAVGKVSFHVRDGLGLLCQSSIATSSVTGSESVVFEPKNPCQSTGKKLEAGKTYRFETTITENWSDGNISAGPNGLKECPKLLMCTSTPIRRHVNRPWFELIGQVGPSGYETFPIGSENCYTARNDGELYLYVNDAVFGNLLGKYWALPYFWRFGNNTGKATVTITLVEEPTVVNRQCRATCVMLTNVAQRLASTFIVSRLHEVSIMICSD